MAEPDDAKAAVIAAALDYYEGWFDGSADRMERALHEALVKRDVVDGSVDSTSKAQMVEATAAGVGRRRDPGDRRVAPATVTSAVYVDYLQFVRVERRWQILNALWA